MVLCFRVNFPLPDLQLQVCSKQLVKIHTRSEYCLSRRTRMNSLMYLPLLTTRRKLQNKFSFRSNFHPSSVAIAQKHVEIENPKTHCNATVKDISQLFSWQYSEVQSGAFGFASDAVVFNMSTMQPALATNKVGQQNIDQLSGPWWCILIDDETTQQTRYDTQGTNFQLQTVMGPRVLSRMDLGTSYSLKCLFTTLQLSQ